MRRTILLISAMALLLMSAGMADDKKISGSADLSFVVIKETNGKPVRNASVILHTLNEDGKQRSGGINLKTDSDGKTEFRGVPFGKLRIQVIARGFQTYGEDYEISQPAQEIKIKLHPPKDQYTIYK